MEKLILTQDIGNSINRIQQTIHETSIGIEALRAEGRLNLPSGEVDPLAAELAKQRWLARSALHYLVSRNEHGKRQNENLRRTNLLSGGYGVPVRTGRNEI